MTKAIYTGVDGVARKAKAMYVGVDGVARKVKKAYVGVDGVAKLFYDSQIHLYIHTFNIFCGTQAGDRLGNVSTYFASEAQKKITDDNGYSWWEPADYGIYMNHTYRLAAYMDGYTYIRHDKRIEYEQDGIGLYLEPTGGLMVYVYDASTGDMVTGKPLQYLGLSVADRSGTPIEGLPEVMTDANGCALFRGLVLDSSFYTIASSNPKWDTSQYSLFKWDASTTDKTVIAVVWPTRGLTVKVYDNESYAVIPNVSVTIGNMPNSPIRTTTTNTQGEAFFLSDELPLDGTYYLNIVSDNYQDYSQLNVSYNGGSQTLNVSLEPTPQISTCIMVKDYAGDPLSAVNVSVNGTSIGITDTMGQILTLQPLGERIEITLALLGYISVRANVVIQRGSPFGITIPMPRTAQIIFDSCGGSEIERIDTYQGARFNSFPTPERASYVFKGWYLDDALTEPVVYPFVVSGNTALTASWKARIAYTIMMEIAIGGSASSNKDTAAEGEQVTFTAMPDVGSEFLNWEIMKDGETTPAIIIDNPLTYTMPACNIGVTPVFNEGSPPVPSDPITLVFKVTGTDSPPTGYTVRFTYPDGSLIFEGTTKALGTVRMNTADCPMYAVDGMTATATNGSYAGTITINAADVTEDKANPSSEILFDIPVITTGTLGSSNAKDAKTTITIPAGVNVIKFKDVYIGVTPNKTYNISKKSFALGSEFRLSVSSDTEGYWRETVYTTTVFNELTLSFEYSPAINSVTPTVTDY